MSTIQSPQKQMLCAPPLLPRKCLDWALPENYKDIVLGDLEEEFHQKQLKSGERQARGWYTRQALLTALIYLKRTQRGMLMFVISLLVFVAMTLMAFLLSGDLYMFYNFPSLLIVLPPALLFALAATSKKAFRQGFQLMFDDQVELSRAELLSAKRMFITFGNVALLCGGFGVVIGAIAIASNMEPEAFAKVIGPALSVCLLTLLYALIIKIPCYLAEQKILHKLENLDE